MHVPSGLAAAAAVLAGVVTLGQLVSAVAAPSAVDAYEQAQRDRVPSYDVITAYDGVTMLTLVALLAAYVVTCLWLHRARVRAETQSPRIHTRRRIWVWLGWWVPVVSLWFPLQVVRDVKYASAGRATGAGLLAGWWSCWLLWAIGSRVAGRLVPADAAVADASTISSLPWIEAFNTIFLVVALVFWVRIIRDITRTQEAYAR